MDREYDQALMGKRIKEFRQKKNMTQKQVGDASQLSKGHISNLENGVGETISIENLSRIADALGTSLEGLLEDNLVVYSDNPVSAGLKKITTNMRQMDEETLETFHDIVQAYINRKKAGS